MGGTSGSAAPRQRTQPGGLPPGPRTHAHLQHARPVGQRVLRRLCKHYVAAGGVAEAEHIGEYVLQHRLHAVPVLHHTIPEGHSIGGAGSRAGARSVGSCLRRADREGRATGCAALRLDPTALPRPAATASVHPLFNPPDWIRDVQLLLQCGSLLPHIPLLWKGRQRSKAGSPAGEGQPTLYEGRPARSV